MPNGFSDFDRFVEWPAVASGYRRGMSYLDEYGLDTPPDRVASAVEVAMGVIRESFPEGSPPPDRAVDLFIANVVMAAACRFTFDDGAALDQKEVAESLTFFKGFFNSGWHY
ncbi:MULTISPECIES: hypothetical protein [unclassified Streptomyces]|uniref:hypothetical protein n=1 Tax=unclassified Streptomyces TaxID=2593676 RepID=UPI002ED5388A|nr:hypothetical protein OIC96_00005 [Streptomyces sp. NBC_00775]WTI42411.1 hypothetical protein OIC96_49725 [Streptomyces sp. NBC_00775]